MQATGSGLTDIGRRRVINEDAYLVDDDLGLYVVADGMGGHAAGEVASQVTVETVHGMVKRQAALLDPLGGTASPEQIRAAMRLLESAIQAATYFVFGIGQHDPDQQGMGTTVSAIILRGNYGVVAQVGDSRVYLIRQGEVTPLTEDHTLVNWQVKQGIITEEEAAVSPHKNVITRAVGSRDYVQVDTSIVNVHPGDRFLLCSDGLHGYVEEHEIPAIIDLGPSRAIHRFIEIANERGGRDNITAVVAEVI
ncbi:MAG: Stp1/IreP family PP2C-type Ser/Thr phosphatase [Myxococcales bacterium]|nr:Stp1/IreP family PP2C-type Ser/Thr phosphatase [Myxococcales bacterium]